MGSLDKKIEAYKEICRLADVPEVLIENPELILQSNPTKDDIDWAKKIIIKYKGVWEELAK